MGEALRELSFPRSNIVLSTKIYFGASKDPAPTARGLSRKHIIEGLKASLERLGVDYVDIVFAHRPDPSTPVEEIVRAFNWVIDQGWAFYWGTSEWPAEQIYAVSGTTDTFLIFFQYNINTIQFPLQNCTTIILNLA